MEEQLVTFETAKLAKEKGFKELCFAAFHKNNRNDGYFESGIISQSEYFKFPTMSNGDKIAVLQKDYVHTILRPTQSLLQKWLREKHNIYVTSKPYIDDVSNETDENIKFQILWENEIIDVKDSYNVFSDYTYYHNYEEALEIGLQEGLKLIK